MIREDRFVMSRRQYAVNLNSLDIEEFEGGRGKYWWRFSFNAGWYRKDGERIRACMGKLCGSTMANEGMVSETPDVDILRSFKDSRYGGNCFATLDNHGVFWSDRCHFTAMQVRHDFLNRMMLDVPTIPNFYDGWWRFETEKELAK